MNQHTQDAFETLPALRSHTFTLQADPRRLGWLEPVPLALRTDRDALWRRLQSEGYLYLTGFFPPESILAFRSTYFEALAPTGLLAPGSVPVDGVAGTGPVDTRRLQRILFDEIVPGPAYQALCAHPLLVNFFAWLLKGEVRLHMRKLIRHVAVGEHATGAHYDLVYLRQGTERVYTAWIPLGDIPVTRGGLVYLEGSHQYFEQMDQYQRRQDGGASVRNAMGEWLTTDLPALADRLDTRWLIANYAAGDVVIHTPYMGHASLNNADPHGVFRLSTDIRYQRADDSIDARWQQHWRPDDGL